jgi:hypothetical protein
MLKFEKLTQLVPLSCFYGVLVVFYLMMLNYLTSLNKSKLFADCDVISCFIAQGWVGLV